MKAVKSLASIASLCIAEAAVQAADAWPSEVKEIRYISKADGSSQPALIYAPSEALKEARPLLVALHTWGGDYKQKGGELRYAEWCVRNGWLFIHPDFRGPNDKPQAMGSDLVVADIVSAVDHMKANYRVDAGRIYLVGGSGGGYASLLMAAKRPDIWAGVSAWCPISDIRKWHMQCKTAKPPRHYYENIEKSCGGDPETSSAAADECVKRSPVTYLKNAKSVNLDISTGVHDGRTGSVPFTHSLYAFNEVAADADKIPAEEIEGFYAKEGFPPQAAGTLDDPAYGRYKPLFRRISGDVRVTIFEGGHDIVHTAALNWLAMQRKGVPAVWKIENVENMNVPAAAKEEIGK